MAGSFTENFNKLVRSFLTNEVQTLADYNGTSRTTAAATQTTDGCNAIKYYPDPLFYLGSSYGIEGNLVCGITVGTSDTAFNASDYNCKALIAHGDNDGQLHYMQNVIGALSVNGSGVGTKQISRIVTNNGTVNVTVKELAFLALVRMNDVNQFGVCIYREVLASPVVIQPTQSATFRVTYSIPNFVTIT